MKIGIYDDKFYALQARLLQEGHELVVYVGNYQIPKEKFNVTGVKKGSIVQAATFGELIDADCDLYVTGTAHAHQAYETLRVLGKNVLGYTEGVCELEYNRDYAFRVLKMIGAEKLGLRIPEQKEFVTIEQAQQFLKKTNGSWVLKQSKNSPAEPDNRTVVSLYPHHDQVSSMLPANRAWFNEQGQGGVIVEEYIHGHEVCFGRWFDGQNFVGDMYVCEEHKGAQNEDRGRMLTGEVGGWFTWLKNPQGKIVEVFRALEPLLKGKCRGMIDINTRVNGDGMWFLEFTCRWGRPTLEYILGSLAPGAKFGTFLAGLAAGRPPKLPVHRWSVGVTVFSYGIPYGASGIPSIKFSMPPANNKATIQQLFCVNIEGIWHTAEDERQFTVVGTGTAASEAQNAAYQVLNGFSLLGCTWRDDVGNRVGLILSTLAFLDTCKGN